MNRFIIADTPQEIAQALCDKHVVKMPLEEAQMLSTVLRQANPEYADDCDLYKVAHAKHPCTLWAGKTRANYMFAFRLWNHMCLEYTHRYGRNHASERFIRAFREGARYIPSGDMTPHPECFGEHAHLKSGDDWPVDSYRKFYHTKQHRFDMRWRNRNKPTWFDWQWENVYA
jgi:hypothetical protein